MTTVRLTALFTLLASAPAPAFALSCLWGLYDSSPRHGATGVPTNVGFVLKYWNTGPETEGVTLRDVSGDELVPIDIATGEDAMTVKAHLEPHREYLLTAPSARTDEERYHVIPFWTGGGPDDDAPDAPEITALYASVGSDEWGEWKWLVVETDLGEVSNEVILEGEIATDDVFSDARRYTSLSHMLRVGDGPCGGNHADIAAAGYFVRVRAVDTAGNASGWTTYEGGPFRVGATDTAGDPADGPSESGPDDDGAVPGYGCAAVAGPWWLGLAVLALVGRRMRCAGGMRAVGTGGIRRVVG